MPLPYSIPAISNVQDPVTLKSILEAMKANLEELYGVVGDGSAQAVTASSLADDVTRTVTGEQLLGYTAQNEAQRGQPDGYPPLGPDAKVAAEFLSDVNARKGTERSSGTIAAYRVVKYDANQKIEVCDGDVAGHKDTAIGILLEPATLNQEVVVLYSGLVSNSGWAFVPPAKVYVGSGGVVGAAGGGFTQQIGTAKSATRIACNIFRAV